MKSLKDIFFPIKLIHQQFLLIFLTGLLHFFLGLYVVHLPFWALQKETKTQVAEDYASWGLTKCQCATCPCLLEAFTPARGQLKKSPQGYQVLIPKPCECDLIWGKGLCKWD